MTGRNGWEDPCSPSPVPLSQTRLESPLLFSFSFCVFSLVSHQSLYGTLYRRLVLVLIPCHKHTKISFWTVLEVFATSHLPYGYCKEDEELTGFAPW